MVGGGGARVSDGALTIAVPPPASGAFGFVVLAEEVATKEKWAIKFLERGNKITKVWGRRGGRRRRAWRLGGPLSREWSAAATFNVRVDAVEPAAGRALAPGIAPRPAPYPHLLRLPVRRPGAGQPLPPAAPAHRPIPGGVSDGHGETRERVRRGE